MLYIYKENKGVPIGDQSSQVFGLIYLLEINHYIKYITYKNITIAIIKLLNIKFKRTN